MQQINDEDSSNVHLTCSSHLSHLQVEDDQLKETRIKKAIAKRVRGDSVESKLGKSLKRREIFENAEVDIMPQSHSAIMFESGTSSNYDFSFLSILDFLCCNRRDGSLF